MDTNLEAVPTAYASVILNKLELIETLNRIAGQKNRAVLRKQIAALKQTIASSNGDQLKSLNTDDTVCLRRDVLVSELDQILEARTIDRARYYLKRLERGIEKVRTGAINDINLSRWKEYTDVITDSLWVLPKRDGSGAHLGWYWGNFIPQIPRQLMLRYTKKGDWVLDAFLGSGTTLIECRRMGRNGVGIELNPEIARKAGQVIEQEPNAHSIRTKIVTGDSRTTNARRLGVKQVQLLIMHPPYHDIIKFSEDSEDLSNAQGIEGFLTMFNEVVDNLSPRLEKGRYFALVIGDKYSKGEWVPLGFECMSEVLKRGFLLKSIIVKNFEETRAKRDQKQLWRYRALAGGFYIFKHEYIFLFRKK